MTSPALEASLLCPVDFCGGLVALAFLMGMLLKRFCLSFEKEASKDASGSQSLATPLRATRPRVSFVELLYLALAAICLVLAMQASTAFPVAIQELSVLGASGFADQGFDGTICEELLQQFSTLMNPCIDSLNILCNTLVSEPIEWLLTSLLSSLFGLEQRLSPPLRCYFYLLSMGLWLMVYWHSRLLRHRSYSRRLNQKSLARPLPKHPPTRDPSTSPFEDRELAAHFPLRHTTHCSTLVQTNTSCLKEPAEIAACEPSPSDKPGRIKPKGEYPGGIFDIRG